MRWIWLVPSYIWVIFQAAIVDLVVHEKTGRWAGQTRLNNSHRFSPLPNV
jgi:hypothetical protein